MERMNFSVFNTKLCDKMMALGLSIPAEDIENYELPEEDVYKVFRNQFMTCKEDVLRYLAKQQDTSLQATNGGYDKLYSLVEVSNLFEAPEGYWHYVVVQDSEGACLKLKLVEVTGYVDCLDLVYYIDEINDEYTMFQVDIKMNTDINDAMKYYFDLLGIDPIEFEYFEATKEFISKDHFIYDESVPLPYYIAVKIYNTIGTVVIGTSDGIRFDEEEVLGQISFDGKAWVNI